MTLDDRLLKPAGWQYDDYKTAKQAILSDLLEIIGEDDDVMAYINQKSDEDLVNTIGENANNRLRAELREKVKEYCK